MINNPDFIRNLIKGNNIIWYLMYYDELVMKSNCHLTFLENADLPFYNTAQAVSDISTDSLHEIEHFYKKRNVVPAFYLDPASVEWLKPYLEEHGYSELPSELENWWGAQIEKSIVDVKFQNYLKIPESHVKAEIIDPKNDNDLNQFLAINQTASQLPDPIVAKLRAHMQTRVYTGATNRILIAYVNNVPASVGTLGFYDNRVFLAEAGTLPQFQKLGLHTYTTLFFLKYAYECGARFAALTCTHDSVTNFTSKRVGFELLFQRQFMRCNGYKG